MSFFQNNRYGECVADDVAKIVQHMEQYARIRGASLGLNKRRLGLHILKYISLRQETTCHNISAPLMEPYKPEGWAAREEGLWLDWVHYTFSLDSWHDEVMNSVFGTDVRFWESRIEGWRSEIMEFLPWWLSRSIDIVDAFDPTSVDLDEIDQEKSNIDPYLLDHGSAKQKRDHSSCI